MIELILLAAIAGEQPSLRWEGSAEVYSPGRTLKIAVRSSIDAEGNVVSESWPVEIGEAKGLRRMTLTSSGGSMERGGEKQPMPPDIWTEERAQFQFYRQLQVASAQAPAHIARGVNTFSVDGEVKTWFRTGPDGAITEAVNEVPTGGRKAHQTFRFSGFWNSSGAVFPKHMTIIRDSQPYFTLDVAKFDAR